MKLSKKMLSIIFALVMAITCVMPVFADTYATSGTCGENVTWSYDASTYTLTISGTGAMTNYSSSNRPWEDYEDSIKTVVIEDGVTSIGNYSFYDFESLTSIVIPDSVTSIGNSVFLWCYYLESVTIGNGVTSIGHYAFEYCDYIKSVLISDLSAWCKINFDSSTSNPLRYGADLYLNGEKVTDLVIPDDVSKLNNHVFYNCTSLESVTIPDSITSIGTSAFRNCTSLESIIIGDNVTSIGNDAFYNTAYYNDTNNWDNDVFYIDEYLVDAKDTISGTYIIKDGTKFVDDYVFSDCTSLTSITIPDSVVSIGNSAFSGCTNLTSVTIPNSVTSIGNSAFSNCTSLTSITIPDSVVSIGNSAFSGCKSLTSVTIGDSVTSIGRSAFNGCTNIKAVYITDILAWCNIDFASIYSNPLYNGADLYLNGEKITDLVIPNSVTSIGDYAFSNCTSLTSITIPDSVTSIGDYAFYGCTSITSVTIPVSVKTIGEGAFACCDSLISVTIGNNVATIGYGAFYDCTSLTDVYYGCTEKQWNEIIIDNTKVEGVENGNAPLHNATKHFSGHTYDWYTISVATCETDGLMIGECSVCEDIDFKSTPMTGHNMVDGVCTNCAENTTGGNSKPTCTIHNYEWETVVEVSCTQDGVCVGTCTVCEDVAVDYHDAKGHEYVETVTAPTCTAQGYTTYTCDCGDSYKDSFVDATGHNYTSVVTAPTCTKQGYTTYTCACGDSYNDDVVDALGHTTAVSENILVAPTCTENGSKEVVVICTICNKEMNRETTVVDAKGHDLVNGDCANCDYTENTGNEDNNDDNNEDVTDPSENCSCNCHKSGISNFFFKIGLFFQKIFGSNKYCGCGVAHY